MTLTVKLQKLYQKNSKRRLLSDELRRTNGDKIRGELREIEVASSE